MRYKNLEPPYEPHDFGKVFKWAVSDQLLGRRRRSPRRADVPVVEPDYNLIDRGDPSLTWVGHATWLIRLCGQSIVTDPVWSDSLGPGIVRNVAPGLSLERAAPTMVLVTHNHRDHLDSPTIDKIGDRATYFVPKGLRGFFEKKGIKRIHDLEWWQSANSGEVKVTFVPSQHWSRRGAFDVNESLWGGYVVEGAGLKIYHSGDTAYFGGFSEIGRRFPKIDAALLPIGAYDPEWFMRVQHMNPDDALHAFVDLDARLLCAMHWGTFKLTDEPLTEPPEKLEEARAREGVSRDRVWIAAIGETRPLVDPDAGGVR